MDALTTAIERAGGVAALAQKLNIEPSAVTNWVRRKRLPTDRAIQLETLTGVPLRELRPELFRAPAAQPVEAA